jgi:hypothetical protein
MSDVLTIEFNTLPRSVRDRFVAITNGAAGPAPILSQKTSAKSKIVGLSFLFVLLALVALLVVVVGFGDYSNELGIHGPLYVIFLYVPFAFLVFLVALSIVTRLVVRSPFPFQPGRYLFPSDFVDARTGTLRIVPTRLLTDFKGVHMHTNGRYTHTTLTYTFQGATEQFIVRGQDAAQAATNAFWDYQRMLTAAAQAQDWHTIANLDPFFECRRTGIWQEGALPTADPGPRVKTVPAFFRWRAAVAVLIALVACPPLALARNLASDEVMYSSAKSTDSESSYDDYVTNGWRHLDEAKLARPIAAFREAKQKGSVTEMRRVLKTYPGSSVEADARASLHELYAKTLRDFRAKASSADPQMLPFMERLIDYMEKNDTSTVRVVFSAPTNGALADADALFQKKYSGAGKTVEPISPYFDEKRSESREEQIVEQLNKAFSSIFPTDVLALAQSDDNKTGSKDPAISIAYSVGPSGDAYKSDDDTEIFVGIDVGFTMQMMVPSDTKTFDFKLKVSPPDRFRYEYMEGTNQAQAAYEAMAQRAFDEFTTKLQAVFFKNVPDAK